jgi:hypothetical protein
MMHAVLSASDYVAPYLLGRPICMNLGLEQVGSILTTGNKLHSAFLLYIYILSYSFISKQLAYDVHYCRVTRNPYDITKISGGSSSGSAAVVAAGLCPVALGVDGGGKLYYFKIFSTK